MMIRIWKINVFHEDFNKLQESTIFHDHEAINTSINMMNQVFIMIWLQDHVLIWQARLEIWYANMMITKFACECRWQTNYKSILSSVISEMIWKNMTCFYESQTQ